MGVFDNDVDQASLSVFDSIDLYRDKGIQVLERELKLDAESDVACSGIFTTVKCSG